MYLNIMQQLYSDTVVLFKALDSASVQPGKTREAVFQHTARRGSAHVRRGFDSTEPSSVTIPTPTLFADPSMPSTYTIGLEVQCGAAHACARKPETLGAALATHLRDMTHFRAFKSLSLSRLSRRECL